MMIGIYLCDPLPPIREWISLDQSVQYINLHLIPMTLDCPYFSHLSKQVLFSPFDIRSLVTYLQTPESYNRLYLNRKISINF